MRVAGAGSRYSGLPLDFTVRQKVGLFIAGPFGLCGVGEAAQGAGSVVSASALAGASPRSGWRPYSELGPFWSIVPMSSILEN